MVTPSFTSLTRDLESNRTAKGILIFSDIHGYATQQLSGHAARLVVADLTEHNEKARGQFAEPTVVNAGSYEGCGCGFNYCANCTAEDLPSPDTDQSAAVTQESRAALAAFVETHGVTTLFGCWAGDEAIPCESEIDISVSQLRDATIALPERARMTIRP